MLLDKLILSLIFVHLFSFGIGKKLLIFISIKDILFTRGRIDWSINSLQVAHQLLWIRLIHSLSSIEFSTLKKHKFPLFPTFFPRDFHTILSRVDDKGCNNDTQLKITGSMPMFAYTHTDALVFALRDCLTVYSRLYRRHIDVINPVCPAILTLNCSRLRVASLSLRSN